MQLLGWSRNKMILTNLCSAKKLPIRKTQHRKTTDHEKKISPALKLSQCIPGEQFIILTCTVTNAYLPQDSFPKQLPKFITVFIRMICAQKTPLISKCL